MPEPKAQLVDPQGPIDVPGINATGIVTATGGFTGNVQGAATGFAATTYNLNVGIVTGTKFQGNTTGNVSGLADDTNINVGIITSTSFTGDLVGNAAGLSTTTANINAGIMSATSFAGNFTGLASGITGTPNVVAGIVTATQFVGNTPGLAGGISAGKNLAAGIVTATTFYGDGSALTGAGSTAFIKQDVTAVSGTTTINLNLGNIIYLTHSNNTTIAFSNVPTATDITIIRTLTDNTITWPAAITWNGASAPTLLGANSRSPSAQVFNLVTADGGTTWYGYEEMSNSPLYWTGFYAFGDNVSGVFGNNNETDASGNDSLPGMTPIQAFQSSNITKFGQFSGGNENGLMVINEEDKTLWGVGLNDYGELGQNNKTTYSSPVQIPGTNWRSVFRGNNNVFATKTDGTLWSWGRNVHGSLGQSEGHNSSKSSPTQIGEGTDWAGGIRSMSASWGHAHVIKADGTMWSMGQNSKGQLGVNLSGTGFPSYENAQSSPKQVPGI